MGIWTCIFLLRSLLFLVLSWKFSLSFTGQEVVVCYSWSLCNWDSGGEFAKWGKRVSSCWRVQNSWDCLSYSINVGKWAPQGDDATVHGQADCAWDTSRGGTIPIHYEVSGILWNSAEPHLHCCTQPFQYLFNFYNHKWFSSTGQCKLEIKYVASYWKPLSEFCF